MVEGRGLGLSRRFYDQLVSPLLERRFPELQHGAARVGPGSEVLGYDTDISADHDFGPAVQIFISQDTFSGVAKEVMQALDHDLPEAFEGLPTRYENHLRAPRSPTQPGMLGSDHGVDLYTVAGWSDRFLGRQFNGKLAVGDWLSYPEQLFLIVTAGAVFRDDLGDFTALRQRLAYFPRDVWLYKLAAQWGRVAEERAYVGRAGEADDELGSRVIAARMVGNLMRLALLVERRYVPYAKWLGTAFSRLGCAQELAPVFSEVLSANRWTEREAKLLECCQVLAERQLETKIPGAIAPTVGSLHGRPFRFIDTVKIGEAIRASIADPDLRAMPPFGAADQFLGSNFVLAVPKYTEAVTSALLDTESRTT